MNLGHRETLARIMATIRMILSLAREEEKLSVSAAMAGT
jgi:hypothetical protein